MKLLTAVLLLATVVSVALAARWHQQVLCDIGDYEEDARALLKCLNECKEDYNVVIDGQGYLVVLPTEKREIDISTIDAALSKCALKHHSRVAIALQGRDEDEDEDERRSYKLQDATFEPLKSEGWKGMSEVPLPDFSHEEGRPSSPSWALELSDLSYPARADQNESRVYRSYGLVQFTLGVQVSQ